MPTAVWRCAGAAKITLLVSTIREMRYRWGQNRASATTMWYKSVLIWLVAYGSEEKCRRCSGLMRMKNLWRFVCPFPTANETESESITSVIKVLLAVREFVSWWLDGAMLEDIQLGCKSQGIIKIKSIIINKLLEWKPLNTRPHGSATVNVHHTIICTSCHNQNSTYKCWNFCVGTSLPTPLSDTWKGPLSPRLRTHFHLDFQIKSNSNRFLSRLFSGDPHQTGHSG